LFPEHLYSGRAHAGENLAALLEQREGALAPR